MSNSMKKNIKTALVLAIFAFVAGALLVGVRALTYVPYSFSMTNADSTAISSLTNSSSFGVIDHNAIKENGNVRVILRIEDGVDKGKYLIRGAAEGFEKGLVETYTLIDNTDGKILNVEICRVDAANSYYASDVKPNLPRLISNLVGKTSLGAFNKDSDGVAGATFTSNGFYDSVKTAINYYNSNKTAINSSTVTKTVGLLAGDPILKDIKTLYEGAGEYTKLGAYTNEAYTITAYVTDYYKDDADFGIVLEYAAEEGRLMFEISSKGIIGAEPSNLSGADDAFISMAVDIIERYAGISTDGYSRIEFAFELDNGEYCVFARRNVSYGQGNYNVTVAYIVSTSVDVASAKPLCVVAIGDLGMIGDYMNPAIKGVSDGADGVANATVSYDAVTALKNSCEEFINALIA